MTRRRISLTPTDLPKVRRATTPIATLPATAVKKATKKEAGQSGADLLNQLYGTTPSDATTKKSTEVAKPPVARPQKGCSWERPYPIGDVYAVRFYVKYDRWPAGPEYISYYRTEVLTDSYLARFQDELFRLAAITTEPPTPIENLTLKSLTSPKALQDYLYMEFQKLAFLQLSGHVARPDCNKCITDVAELMIALPRHVIDPEGKLPSIHRKTFKAFKMARLRPTNCDIVDVLLTQPLLGQPIPPHAELKDKFMQAVEAAMAGSSNSIFKETDLPTQKFIKVVDK